MEKQREALLRLDNGLHMHDLNSLIFLSNSSGLMSEVLNCQNGNPACRPISIFDIFEKNRLLEKNNWLLLGNLLIIIGRKDLFQILEDNRYISQSDFPTNSCQSTTSRVCPFRTMLFEISEELHRHELDTLRIFSNIPARKTIESGIGFFSMLIESEDITHNDVSELHSWLQDICRFDLVAKLDTFSDAFVKNRIYTWKSPTPIQRSSSRVNESLPWKPGVMESHQDMETQSMGLKKEPAFSDSNRYQMSSSPRGICLIIDNYIFTRDAGDPSTSPPLKERNGSIKDRESLVDCFAYLHFDVKVMENVTNSEMVQELNRISYVDHTQYSCFVCCILSHGQFGSVFGSNCQAVPIRAMTSMFTSQSCPSLGNKPKLFFLACCQGEKIQEAGLSQAQTIEADDGLSTSGNINNAGLIPNEADFLLGYSTIPGFISYRSTTEGTWYIQSLTKIFKDFAAKEEIHHLLLRTNNEVSKFTHTQYNAENKTTYNCKQVPAPQHTLRKQLWFL